MISTSGLVFMDVEQGTVDSNEPIDPFCIPFDIFNGEGDGQGFLAGFEQVKDG